MCEAPPRKNSGAKVKFHDDIHKWQRDYQRANYWKKKNQEAKK